MRGLTSIDWNTEVFAADHYDLLINCVPANRKGLLYVLEKEILTPQENGLVIGHQVLSEGNAFDLETDIDKMLMILVSLPGYDRDITAIPFIKTEDPSDAYCQQKS